MRSIIAEQILLIFNFFYTAFHKYVPKYGIAVYVVVERKRLNNGTFF